MFGRDKDQVGVAVDSAGFGRGARAVAVLSGRTATGRETVVEATYRFAWRDWLSVQPDLQYVIRPHGDPRLADAVVAGVRLALAWSR